MTILTVGKLKNGWYIVNGIPHSFHFHGPHKNAYRAYNAAYNFLTNGRNRNYYELGFDYCLSGIECGGSETHTMPNGTIRCNTCKKVWFF
jgi:hypothetical protein